MRGVTLLIGGMALALTLGPRWSTSSPNDQNVGQQVHRGTRLILEGSQGKFELSVDSKGHARLHAKKDEAEVLLALTENLNLRVLRTTKGSAAVLDSPSEDEIALAIIQGPTLVTMGMIQGHARFLVRTKKDSWIVTAGDSEFGGGRLTVHPDFPKRLEPLARPGSCIHALDLRARADEGGRISVGRPDGITTAVLGGLAGGQLGLQMHHRFGTKVLDLGYTEHETRLLMRDPGRREHAFIRLPAGQTPILGQGR